MWLKSVNKEAFKNFQVRYHISLSLDGEALSRESPLSKGFIDTSLNCVGNLPSLKERLAKWVIILENIPKQAMKQEWCPSGKI